MFIYDDSRLTAVNKDRIRALYIDRVESAKAYSQEDHDRMDVFYLRAFLGGRASVILSEVVGVENIPKLKERMNQITGK